MDIKTLRKRYKLTQEEIAQRIGVSWTTVSRWENKRTEKPHKVTLMAIERLKNELKKEKRGAI